MNAFVKSFIFPFLIALVIFSLIAVAVIPPVINMVFGAGNGSGDVEDDSQGGDRSSAGSSMSYRANGIFSMLLICTDEAPAPAEVSDPVADDPENVDENAELRSEFAGIQASDTYPISKNVQFITFVVFDSILKRAAVTYLPAETMVSFRGTYVDLDTMLYYAENGLYDTDLSFFSDYMLSLTGYYVDFYGFIDIDNYVKFASEYEGLSVNLTESVSVYQENGRIVQYPAGERAVTSSDLYNLIKHDSYSSPSVKGEILESFSLSVLEEVTSISRYSTSDQMYQKCVANMWASNADHDIFVDKAPLFFSYGVYTHSKLNIIGTLSDTDGRTFFYPNKSASSAIFK